MTGLARYARLYTSFLRFSLQQAMAFRFDFFFRILMDSVYYINNIVLFLFIYRHTQAIGHWGEAEVMVFVCGFLVVDALQMVFISSNMWWLPQAVNTGALDYFVVRPVSSLFFLSLRTVSVNSMVNLVMALGLLSWALVRLPRSLGVGEVALYGFLLVVGFFITFGLQLLAIIPVFWIHSVEGFRNFYFSSGVFAERPDFIFPRPMRVILTTVAPFALMASLPARILIDGFRWEWFLNVVGVAIILWGAVIWAWQRGLRAYSSASS